MLKDIFVLIVYIVMGVVFVTGLSGVTSAFHAGVIPHADLIQSYTSTGGTPEYKDSNTDLVYKVQQGDTLTFSITLNPGYTNLECEWTVRKGSAVLTSGSGTTFSWTVPSENSTWEIEAEVFLRDAVGNPVGKDTVSWSITTVDVVTVNPGESIQNAIDSLTNGGIVELKAGNWSISTPIRIRANNITLRGQGIGVTRILVTNEDTDAIVVGRWDDFRQRSSDIYNDPYHWMPWSVTYPQDHENHPENWTDNTIIKFLTIDGLSTPDWFPYAGIGGVQLWNTFISGVEIIGDSCDDSILIALSAAVFPTVKDCELKNCGSGARFSVGSGGIKVINNFFHHCTFYNGLEFNGGLCCGDNLVKGNQFINGGGIEIYSSHDVIVTENLLENGYGSHGGIISSISHDIVISKNIVKNSNYNEAAIRIGWAIYGGDVNISITNNLLFNNRDHGIFIRTDNQDRDWWANLSLVLTSNTVVSSQKSGIFFGIDKDTSLADATLRSHLKINSVIRNNIVVNNGEAGINSAQNIVVDENGVKTVTGQDIEYNDVWNNTGGNYVDCNPGDNDISTDPLFADPANGDFHLKSQYGRWNGTDWVNDNETSPCIDAGDPSEKDLDGTRINIGAYGGTDEASKSEESQQRGDLNNNGEIGDTEDLILIWQAYLGIQEADWRYDLNQDGKEAGIADVLVMWFIWQIKTDIALFPFIP